MHPFRHISSYTRAARFGGLAVVMALGACSADPLDSDTLELATMRDSNIIPKSSPGQLRRVFDRFCVKGTGNPDALDTQLRAASYVPMRRGQTAAARTSRLYVVDDRRPAVIVSDRICGVRAISRTGQTEEINSYITNAFPKARPMATDRLNRDVEQAWQIDDGIIATTRNRWIGNRSAFTVLLFRPEARDG